MKKISKRVTRTSQREIPVIAPPEKANGANLNAIRKTGGARINAVRRTAVGKTAVRKTAVRRTPHSTINYQPSTSLSSALTARRKFQTDLSALNQLLTEKAARQSALEKTGDLHNPAVITEIATLQVFTRILPQRITAQEADDATAEQNLIKATNDFIHQYLGPRIRKLAFEKREKVTAELKPHHRDPRSLIVAVTQSQELRTIESLSRPITSQPPHGAIAHAEGTLKAWAAADEFEKRHLCSGASMTAAALP
jgi:hypothetical protein